MSPVTPWETYRDAAGLLWGPAGTYAADEFDRLNRDLFAGSIPALPIVIGLLPYGGCIGMTRSGFDWLDSPRITLPPEVFNGSDRLSGGRRQVSDVLVHEMTHAVLMFRGEDSKHNGLPWCRLIAELSPPLLGCEITARPVRTRRVPNPARQHDPKAPKTVVVRRPDDGAMAQRDLARWPHCVRPDGYYDQDDRIRVPTY